jgi:GNAT superfamily N-acetyltransferase
MTGFSLKILALKPAYWKRGLGMALIARVTQNAMAKGYSWVDCSLTSEANLSINRLAAKFGASVYRRYREYRLSL